jgi:hypothetical protein
MRGEVGLLGVAFALVIGPIAGMLPLAAKNETLQPVARLVAPAWLKK